MSEMFDISEHPKNPQGFFDMEEKMFEEDFEENEFDENLEIENEEEDYID